MNEREFTGMMLAVVQRFFKLHQGLDPVKTQIYLGTYEAYLVSPFDARLAVGAKSIELSKGLKMPFAYSINYDLKPVPAIRWGDGWDLKMDWQPGGKHSKWHLMEGRRIADIVVDSLPEMMACKFPWAKDIDALSKNARLEFSRNLGEIKFMPDAGTELGPDQVGGKFIQDLAHFCTFDSNGKYYKKWRPHKENTIADATTLTAEYYKNIFQEQVLVRDKVYVAVLSATQYELWLLEADDKGNLKEKIVYQLVDQYTAGQMHVDAQDATKEALFFYTLHGAKDWHPPSFKEAHVHQQATQRLADPVSMVMATAGKDAKKLLKLGDDDWDWFVEMAARYFKPRFYTIDLEQVKKSFQTFVGDDLFRKEMKDYLEEALRDLKGNDPITAEFRARIQQQMSSPNLLLIPQGAPVSDHDRFVGIEQGGPVGMDGPYCYFRNTQTGYVWKMPLLPMVRNLRVGSVSREIYNSTKGMLPFIQAVVWAGVAVMAIEFIGPKFVYDWAKKQAGKKAMKALIHEFIKMAKPAILALFVKIIASIFSLDRIKAFAEGFFHGYAVHAVYQHFVDHATTYVTEGPLEYRLAKMAMHLQEQIESLQKKLEFLRTELSDDGQQKTLKQGIQHFEGFSIHLVQGIALLTSAMYWVDHKDASPFAAAVTDTVEGGAPDIDGWNTQAAHGLSAFIREMTSAIVDPDKLEKEVGKTGDKLQLASDILKPLFHTPVMGGVKVFGIIYSAILLQGVVSKMIGAIVKGLKLAAGKVPVKVWLLAALAGTIYLVEKYEESSDTTKDAIAEKVKSTAGKVEDVAKFLGTAIENLFTMDAATAKVFGELAGNLFGAFVVDHALHDWKGAFDKKFADKPILKGLAKVASFHGDMNLHHGKIGQALGILKLLLYRYVEAWQVLVTKGLLAKKRDDSAFAKLITEIDEMALKNKLDERGLGHLMAFRSENEQAMNFQKVGLALVSVLHILEDDQKDYLKAQYGGDLPKYRKELKVFSDALDDLGVEKWAKEREQWMKDNYKMVFHHLQLHLRAAVHQLVLAFGEAFAPFTVNGFSWMSLLQELGLPTGPLDKLHDKLSDDLKMFK